MSPLISEFDGMKVRMNELDHEPTHLHVKFQGKDVFRLIGKGANDV